jgi:hypothetical protein
MALIKKCSFLRQTGNTPDISEPEDKVLKMRLELKLLKRAQLLEPQITLMMSPLIPQFLVLQK